MDEDHVRLDDALEAEQAKTNAERLAREGAEETIAQDRVRHVTRVPCYSHPLQSIKSTTRISEAKSGSGVFSTTDPYLVLPDPE